MKSKPYKLDGKLFRYDFDHSMVEYIFKAEAEDIAFEQEWEKTHDYRIYEIDADGYMVMDAAGLHKDNWTNKAARDEYLAAWSVDLDAEAAAMEANFVKYELPYLR